MLSKLLRGSTRCRTAALAAARLVFAALPAASQQQEARLLRFPHIHGNSVGPARLRWSAFTETGGQLAPNPKWSA
jgi:hypothetical protein